MFAHAIASTAAIESAMRTIIGRTGPTIVSCSGSTIGDARRVGLRILGRQPFGDRRELGPRLRHGDAGLQPGDSPERNRAALIEEGVRRIPQRCPQVAPAGGKAIDGVGPDTHDRRACGTEADAASDDGPIAAERLPPESLAEHDDGRRTRVKVVIDEPAAKKGSDPEDSGEAGVRQE